MMDTFSRAGSCCQIGENCHISPGSGYWWSFRNPHKHFQTIIEDNVFVGAMSEVVEGVIVGEGSVLSMGCYIGQSTKIVNRSNGEITKGRVPPYSVVVPGIHKDLYAVHIIKTVDAKTRSKTSINDLLRD
jgi:Tetrahydrodipicolinate N-succinyltransferase